MSDCIFCKIVDKKINASLIHEDDQTVAFKDISPQAPIHILVIPKKHIAKLSEVAESDLSLIGHIHRVIQTIAKKYNLIGKGYRVVTNEGSDGGQTVDHIHYHVLGGRSLTWPPG